MYCTKCGKEIKDDAVFCPYCGEPVAQTESRTNVNETKPSDNNLDQNNTSNYDYQYNKASDEMPTMYWYKYLIYVGMFLYSGFLAYILGAYYGGYIVSDFYSEEIYNQFPVLDTFDFFLAIFSLVMSMRGMLIRQDLKYRKKNAGKSFIRDISIYMVGYIVYMLASVITVYGFSVLYIIGDVVILAVDAVFIYCNVRYFKKREYLFQN